MHRQGRGLGGSPHAVPGGPHPGRARQAMTWTATSPAPEDPRRAFARPSLRCPCCGLASHVGRGAFEWSLGWGRRPARLTGRPGHRVSAGGQGTGTGDVPRCPRPPRDSSLTLRGLGPLHPAERWGRTGERPPVPRAAGRGQAPPAPATARPGPELCCAVRGPRHTQPLPFFADLNSARGTTSPLKQARDQTHCCWWQRGTSWVPRAGHGGR